MLAGLPSTDFALTRDFLVMHDDQIGVINSFKNQNLEISESYIENPMQTLNSNEEIDLCSTIEHEKELGTMKIVDNLLDLKMEEAPKKNVRRSKRQINDKKTFCTYFNLLILSFINIYCLFIIFLPYF